MARWLLKARSRYPRPLIFTANDCLDIGMAFGSPVSLDYFEKAPFKFNGTIEQVHVAYRIAKQVQAEDMTTKEEVATSAR